jgi:hypothetical protein
MPSPAPEFPPHIGTKVNALFTISNTRRYEVAMFFAAAAILSASAPQNGPAGHHGPAVQAVAMVRVISGVMLRLDGSNNGGEVPPVRETIYVADGVTQPARLIEFE